MKVYRKGTGERYTPSDHFDMTTEVIFNPDLGCKNANITLSTLKKGAGGNDEVHEHSDQVICIVQGELNVSANGVLLATLRSGDALFIQAGDIHSVLNTQNEDCVYYCITVPPLPKTH